MLLSRPHVESNAPAAMYLANVLSSYWLSPSVSTAAGFRLTSRFDVYFWRQFPVVPFPALKFPSAGSHAMSPAAAITGSPPVGGEHALVVPLTPGRLETLPAASYASTPTVYAVAQERPDSENAGEPVEP